MRGRAAFDEILEQQLQGVKAAGPTDPRTSLHGVATAYGFLFVELSEAPPSTYLDSLGNPSAPAPSALENRFAGAIRTAGAATPQSWNIASRPAAVRASRASRLLTLRERRAFDDFVGFGARLSEDFTLPELRSSFRALALQYHPDRHTSHTSHMADLSARFARIADAYRVLVEAAGRSS